MERMVWPAMPAPALQPQLAIQFQLEQTQWWSAERIREHQFVQLAQLVRHAGATVPYYRELFRRIGFDPRAPLRPEDWERLPILGRRALQDQAPALKSEMVPTSHGKVFELSTSGSTATPVRVVKTSLQQLFFQANTLRDHLWHRRDLRARLASIRNWDSGTDAPYPEGAMSARWGRASAAYESAPSYLLNLSTKVHLQAEWLQRVRPAYLMSYPSNFEALAHHCIDHGVRFPGLRQLRSMSEVLRPEVREICRKAWNVEITDTYSAEEAGIVALQSPVREELLAMAETVYVEVLDETGKPCRPGETGRLVVTPLHAFAMPLLRYALGDLAIAGGAAMCGRGLPVLKAVLGRERNMVKLPDGQIHFPNYAYMMKGFDKLVQFQIARIGVEILEARLVVRAPLDAAEESLMAERIRERFQYPFEVRFRYVEDVARTRGGKFLDYVSEID